MQNPFLSNRYITSLPFCQFYVFPEIPSFSLFSLCSNWHSSIFDMFCRSHLMPCPCRNNSHSKTLPHLEHSSVICLPKINMAMTPYQFCKLSEVISKTDIVILTPTNQNNHVGACNLIKIHIRIIPVTILTPFCF